jgi:hypothetical protein
MFSGQIWLAILLNKFQEHYQQEISTCPYGFYIIISGDSNGGNNEMHNAKVGPSNQRSFGKFQQYFDQGGNKRKYA